MSGPSDAPKAMTLRGRWGSLRPLVASDAARLFHLSHDTHAADTWAEMKVGPFADEAAFANHLGEMLADRTRSFFAITRDGGEALGWLSLLETQEAHRTVELGYVVFAPELRQTTLATEAFYLIIAHIFDDLGFARLEWTCTAENERSRKAATRLGFRFEGVMRGKFILKGVRRDIPMYAMLASEWPARRAALQRWLDPSNFTDGRQLEPLAPA
jgi:RimJ/RimL family protein N-acetyltransferase